MRIFNKGFNFNQDGPGNRLVYHLSGCNMRCKWCANPEGFDKNAGKEVSVKEILAECQSALPMFFSGGGVTFTGGEATLYHEELLILLKTLKENNINTAIETNGTDKKLFELLPFIDYLIMDFKHYDNEKHKFYTGLELTQIKQNFESLCNLKRCFHVRIPLINGVNTDSPQSFCQYFSSFDTSNVVFEFLPYHEYGKNKWTSEYQIKNGFITKQTLIDFYKTFEEYNLKTIKT